MNEMSVLNGACNENQTNKNRSSVLTERQVAFLADVQVSLDVQIGELSMTVEQLIDLVPGKTFEFAFDAKTPLSLRIGEEEIAKARFVMCDGSLALEIVEIFSN